jgi:CubicO group peptidase (beta-lactamase class C family)
VLPILLCSALIHAEASPIDDLRSDVERIELAADGSGVVGLIVEHGVMSSFSTRPDLNAQTPFELASVGKVFTGVLLAIAVEDGLIALDDPIGPQLQRATWMTAPPRPETAAITYRQLATHQSGLPRLPPSMGTGSVMGVLRLVMNFRDPYAKHGFQQLADDVANVHPNPEPEYEYSNFGMGLLGNLTADLFGMSYCDAIQAKVATPLNMDSLSCVDPPDLAVPHFGPFEWTPWHTKAITGAGGLRGNAADMGRFLTRMMTPQSTTQLDRALALTATNDAPKMGLGWLHSERKWGDVWWHNGATHGTNTFVGYAPDVGMGVVLLKNESFPSDDPSQDLTSIGHTVLRRALKRRTQTDNATHDDHDIDPGH